MTNGQQLQQEAQMCTVRVKTSKKRNKMLKCIRKHQIL